MDFITSAFVTGVVGDIGLQLITAQEDRWGFKQHFEEHGVVGSVLLAGGLMVGAALGYDLVFATRTPLNLFLYGGAWDLAFRYLNIMSSLDMYYETNSIPATFVWGGIPMLMAHYFR